MTNLFRAVNLSACLCPLLLLCAPALSAQQPFPLNQYGEVTNNSLNSLAKTRGYELVSAFDTVSKQPLLIYAQYRKNGQFGILDINGKEVTGALYLTIPGLDRGITPNLFSYPKNFIVQEKGKYGLITNTGKQLIPATYEHLYYKSRDSLHYTVIQGGQEWSVDAKGKKVSLPPEKDPWEQNPGSREEDQKLSADGKTYYLKNYWTGQKTTVPNLGTVIQNYGNTVIFKNEQGKMGLYLVSKKQLGIPFSYDEIEYGLPGYYKVRQGALQGVTDSIGQIKIPLVYEHIGFTSGGANTYAAGKYRVFGQQMQSLSEDTFDRITYSGLKGLILQKGGKYGLMSTSGKILAGFDYESMEVPEDHDLNFSIILAQKDGKYGVMDFSGKVYTEFKYDRIVPESLVFSDSRSLEPVFNGYANQPNRFHYVQLNNAWGLLDNDFKPLIEPSYEYFLESYDRSVLFAQKNGKWGMIDLKTQAPIIPLIYDVPIEYKNGNYLVKQNNQYSLLNREGKLLTSLQGTGIDSEQLYKGLWKLRSYQDRVTYFIDYTGRKTAAEKWKVASE